LPATIFVMTCCFQQIIYKTKYSYNFILGKHQPEFFSCGKPKFSFLMLTLLTFYLAT